jgi:uncharacterized protein
LKAGIRFVAVASGPINERKRALIVGVVGRNGVIEGILSSSIEVDGKDSALSIIRMVNSSRFKEQIKLVVLNGIALAGLNVVDIPRLENALKIKTVVLTRGKPRPMLLVRALNEFSHESGKEVRERIALVKEQAERESVLSNGFHLQSTIEEPEIRRLVKSIYEMLRVAHLIARGVETGESKGRI